MKLGSHVTWTSQGGGYTRTKRGVVVAVVAAAWDPYATAFYAGLSVPPTWGRVRDHESYVVRVPGRGLYWPRVSGLRAEKP